VSGKAKKVGRVAPRAPSVPDQSGAHGVTRPTSELREDVTPYRVGQRVPPVSNFGGELPASEMIGDRRDACPTFIDLFCGIGGFRIAFERAGCQCVFSSDWNKYAQQTYAANFGETPHGDIHSVAVADIPAHDILCAGFPRQPFSIATAF